MNLRLPVLELEPRPQYRLLRTWRRDGVSVREAGRRLHVAPRTVQRLLDQLPPEQPAVVPTSALPVPNDPPPGFDPANLRRCRTCGALVYLWPCLACALTGEASNGAEVPVPSPGVTCHAHS